MDAAALRPALHVCVHARACRGLGKTVQVIALVVYMVEVRRDAKPWLIAAPSSVLPNWVSEFARWAPGLRVVDYRGSADTRDAIWNTQVGTYRMQTCIHKCNRLGGRSSNHREARGGPLAGP